MAVLIVVVDAVVVGSAAAAVGAGDPARPIGELSRRPREGTTSAGAPRRARLTGVPAGTPELRFATWPDALSGRRCRPGSVDDEVVAFEFDAFEFDDFEPDRGDSLEDGDSWADEPPSESAAATADVLATAIPTPSATATPPTRPM